MKFVRAALSHCSIVALFFVRETGEFTQIAPEFLTSKMSDLPNISRAKVLTSDSQRRIVGGEVKAERAALCPAKSTCQ
jgi:hypothetical protein